MKLAPGLQKCRFGITGAVPITAQTPSSTAVPQCPRGIQIDKVYRMSECTGTASFAGGIRRTGNSGVGRTWSSCDFAMPAC